MMIVLLIVNGLTSASVPGGVTNMVLAATLIVAAAIDIRWNKNRQRVIRNIYVSPTYLALPPSPVVSPNVRSVFRRRMTQRLPSDEWLIPQVNNGCVLKFSLEGKVLETLWDHGAVNHPMITSMREHKGWLYLGGLTNNRIGRYKLPDGTFDPDFMHYEHRWRKSA